MADNAWKNQISDTEFDALLVARLADRPNASTAYGQGGLSAQKLKEWFDKSSDLLKTKLNAIIAALGGDDALSEISVVADGKTMSAKEWIESMFTVNLNGEVTPIVNWVEIANKAISDRLLSSEVSVDAEPGKVVRRGADGKILVDDDDTAIGASEVADLLADLVTQTLEGFEEEEAKSKAPSVAAVNEGIASSQSTMTKYVDNELRDVKADLVAQTLDGFTEEEAKSKAPSVKAVKAVNSGITEKINDVMSEINTVAARVNEIDLKVGRSYKTIERSFDSTSVTISKNHVGTHVALSHLTPSYGYKGTKSASVSNPRVEPYTDEDDYTGYYPELYDVATAIVSGELRIGINTLAEDLNGYGISIFFDPIAIKNRQILGIDVFVVSGSFTSTKNTLFIDLIRDDEPAYGVELDGLTSAMGHKRKFIHAHGTSLEGIHIYTSDGEVFTNYVIEVSIITEPEIVGEVPEYVYSGGKAFLEDALSSVANLAEEAGASLSLVAFDENYEPKYNSIDLEAMKVKVNVEQTESGLVCLDEPRYIQLNVSSADLDFIFPAKAGETVSLSHTSAMNGIELNNDSKYRYVLKS